MVQSDTNIKTETERIFKRSWFCVALSPSGSIYKEDADSPSQFLETLRNSVVAWVDYVTDDFDREAAAGAIGLGFSESLMSSLASDSPLTYQDFNTEMGMRLPSIQVRHFDVQPYSLLVLLRSNFILTIHPHYIDRRFIRLRRYSDTFIRKIPADIPVEDRLTQLLIRILDMNNDSNFGHLRQIEERGDELNQDMMSPNTPRSELGPKIYAMKHALIIYLDSLWHCVDVFHALRYGDAELVSNDPKTLDRVGLLTEAVNGQIGLAEHMSEVLASGLEVLQSIYNNQLQALNNRLSLVITYLTIIGTAFLVPNTLATMLGNSVFELEPHDIVWYMALMIGSTVAATGLAYWWVRKRGWLPRKGDQP